MRKLVLLSALAFFTVTLHAQLQGQSRLDSLLAQLPKAVEDTNKVSLLNELSLTNYTINPDEGLKFGKQALALAENLEWKKGIAYACKVIAANYGYGKSEYAQALDYLFKAQEQFQEIGDQNGVAKVLGDIGVMYWFQSDYPKALKYYLDALRIHEARGVKHEVAATLGNIGIVYNSQQEYAKALDYMLRANKIDEELGNKSGVAANLGNIGELYMAMSNAKKALEYDSKSLELYKALGDRDGVARNLVNLGVIYSRQKEYGKALAHYQQAYAIHQELGNKIGVATILSAIGDTYFEMAKEEKFPFDARGFADLPRTKTMALQQAKTYTIRAIDLLQEIGERNTLFNNYKRLSEIQTTLGDYKSALTSYQRFAVLKDSVFNQEKEMKLTETALQYEFDKKEAATRAEQAKKDIIQRNLRNSFLAGAVVLLLLLVGLINRYRYKQKANRELAAAYQNLKHTQQQLVQSEKMAAFGMMASRLAHEIQNPLNFVNNFSDVSQELVHDIIGSPNDEVRKETADLLVTNLEKINYHGNRLAGIISQLREHARAGTAQKFFEEEKN